MAENWDYSQQAAYYKYRPNYPAQVIDCIIEYADLAKCADFNVADIGAGTGNLTVLLAKYPCKIIAVEPTQAMSDIGKERTKELKNITWIKADGCHTTLSENTFDLVTFGSSFNVLDRDKALMETARILKKNGVFSCLWNHRDLNADFQKQVDAIIKEVVPDYGYGVRRQDQREIIENSGFFSDIMYMEMDFTFRQTLENYINAWKSVKNQYWDLSTPNGKSVFEQICDKIRKKLPSEFSIKYTCRTWNGKCKK